MIKSITFCYECKSFSRSNLRLKKRLHSLILLPWQQVGWIGRTTSSKLLKSLMGLLDSRHIVYKELTNTIILIVVILASFPFWLLIVNFEKGYLVMCWFRLVNNAFTSVTFRKVYFLPCLFKVKASVDQTFILLWVLVYIAG